MADEIHTITSSTSDFPTLTGETDKLGALLQAVLVDGGTTKSVSSITRSGSTATVTTGSNHNLSTGQMAKIAGAGESEYNGRFVVTVTGSTTFTYTVTGTPSTPASGTITARRASLGWTMPYSGTNKRVFQSSNVASAQHYLRVLDDASSAGGAKEAVIRAYVSMSDVDTGTEPFPTVAQQATGLYWQKSATANSTTRSWYVFGNDKTFYIAINNGTSVLVYGFGHFNSFKIGDAYNTFIAGSRSANSVTATSQCTGLQCGQSLSAISVNSGPSLFVPRPYTQTGTSLNVASYGSGNTSSSGASSHGSGASATSSFGVAIPSANADGAFYCTPIHIMELVSVNANVIRGKIPGIYSPMHAQGTIATDTVSTGISGLNGKSVYHLDHNGIANNGSALAGQLLFDQTGPW